MCRLSGNSGSLNLLEPSGPVQGLLYLYLLAYILVIQYIKWNMTVAFSTEGQCVNTCVQHPFFLQSTLVVWIVKIHIYFTSVPKLKTSTKSNCKSECYKDVFLSNLINTQKPSEWLQWLVWHFLQLYLGYHSELDTCSYELFFLTMADYPPKYWPFLLNHSV